MNKEQVNQKILFTLNNKKFIQENKKYIRKINYIENFSILLTPLSYLGFYNYFALDDYFTIISLIFVIFFYSLSNLHKGTDNNYQSNSWLPEFLFPVNFLFGRFFKKHINDFFNINLKNIKEYNTFINKKNKIYFYYEQEDIQNLIENNKIEEAFYYWSEIDKQSKTLDEKIFARDKIKLLEKYVFLHNEKVKKYNEESCDINAILSNNNVKVNINKEKEIKNIKIVNI
jgi:hypothetical protein